ncbi:hypothetical protein GC207_10625 [bacterium]|nr:hypothetical protein [bacterium]
MKTTTQLLSVLSLALMLTSFASGAFAAETGSLNEHLEAFRPLLSKTWRGEFKEQNNGQPVIDISRWERALNGKAVRVIHSINDGVYGGEIIIQWNSEKQAIQYFYFTTAGFRTEGTMTINDGKFVGVENIIGNLNGTKKVRSTSTLQPDGSLVVKAEYLDDDGKATGGREVTYHEAPDAVVKFR